MPYAWCLAPSWYFTRLLGRYERGRTQEPRTSQRRKPSVRPGAARGQHVRGLLRLESETTLARTQQEKG